MHSESRSQIAPWFSKYCHTYTYLKFSDSNFSLVAGTVAHVRAVEAPQACFPQAAWQAACTCWTQYIYLLHIIFCF